MVDRADLKDLELRDVFAMVALHSLMQDGNYPTEDEDDLADWSYNQADAMMRRRKKNEEAED